MKPTTPIEVCQYCGLTPKTRLEKAAPGLLEACTHLPERKSILAEAAYTGGDVPKKWINDRGHYNDGYNQALADVRRHLEAAIAHIEGGETRCNTQ